MLPLCSAARRPAGGASQDKIQPVFCCPSHASAHVGLCLLRVTFSSFSEGTVESSSSFILNPSFPSCYSHLSPAYTIWILGSFMPVYPFHSFSLCSLISVPSTPLKRLNHNSSGNYSPARQQRSIWHLKPFLKAIFLLTSEGYNSPPYLFLFDRVSFLPFLLQVFL